MNPLEASFKPNKATGTINKTSNEMLDDALRQIIDILKKDAWKNAREIAQLTNAIAGDNKNKKIGLINHYK